MRFVSTSYQRRRQQNRRYKEYDKDPAGSLLQLCRYIPSKTKNGITSSSATGTAGSGTKIIAQQKYNNSLNSSSHHDTINNVDDMNTLYEDIQYIVQNYPSVIHTLDPRNGMNVLHYVCTNPLLINNIRLIQLLLTTSILQSNDSDYPLMDDNDERNNLAAYHHLTPSVPNSPSNKSDTSNDTSILGEGTEEKSGLPIASVLLREKTSIKGQLALHLACSCCSGTASNNSLALITSMPVIEYLIQCHPSAVCIPDKIQQNLPIHEACNWILLLQQQQQQQQQHNNNNNTKVAGSGSSYIEILILLVQQWPESCQIPNRDGNIPLHLAVQRCLSLTTKPLTSSAIGSSSSSSSSSSNTNVNTNSSGSSRSRKDGSSSSSSVSGSVLATTSKRMESVELGILIDDLDDASVYSCSHSVKTTKTSGSHSHKKHPSPSGSDSHDSSKSNNTGTTYTDSSSSSDDDDDDEDDIDHNSNHKYDDDDASFADDDSQSISRSSHHHRGNHDDHHRSKRTNTNPKHDNNKGSTGSKSSSSTNNYYIDKLQQQELEKETKEEKEHNKAKIQASLEIIQYLVNVYPESVGVENKNGLTPYQLALAIMKSYGYSNLYTTRVSLSSHSNSKNRRRPPPSHSIVEFLRRATKKYYNQNNKQERLGI